MAKKKKESNQDKFSIDSRILTMLENLAWQSERKKKKEGKEYGLTVRNMADEIGIHPNTLKDRIDIFTALQDVGIKIKMVEDAKERTTIIVEKDKKNLFEEVNRKLDILLSKDG